MVLTILVVLAALAIAVVGAVLLDVPGERPPGRDGKTGLDAESQMAC